MYLLTILILLLGINIGIEIVQAVSPLAWGPGRKSINNELGNPTFSVVLEEDCHPGGVWVLWIRTDDGG